MYLTRTEATILEQDSSNLALLVHRWVSSLSGLPVSSSQDTSTSGVCIPEFPSFPHYWWPRITDLFFQIFSFVVCDHTQNSSCHLLVCLKPCSYFWILAAWCTSFSFATFAYGNSSASFSCSVGLFDNCVSEFCQSSFLSWAIACPRVNKKFIHFIWITFLRIWSFYQWLQSLLKWNNGFMFSPTVFLPFFLLCWGWNPVPYSLAKHSTV